MPSRSVWDSPSPCSWIPSRRCVGARASREDTLRTLAVMRVFHRNYFRAEATGLEHVPDEGRVLLIGNHSVGAESRRNGYQE